MTADAQQAGLDAAWGLIPQSHDGGSALGSFTRTRVERAISIAIGVGCLALAAQAFVTALGPGEERPPWHTVLLVLTFVPFIAMLVSCFIGRGVRSLSGLFACLYIVALVLWPTATIGSSPTATGQPWIYFLINPATLAAVLAFRLPLQIVWTIATPLLYGVVRLAQSGFARDFLINVGLDVSFALILGAILMTLGWVFRSVAAGVDEARQRTVSSYATVAAAEATEQERVAVGALMHDSVLAALIAVERAHTPRERTLAVSMAREALTRLANTERDAEMGSDDPVSVEVVADELRAAAAELGASIAVSRRFVGHAAELIPGGVARAIVLAATQAITNAIQHANAAGLEASVEAGADPVRLTVVVRDSGPGFDPAAVPDDRLGISASILARVAAVGGRAHIESGHRGTTVTLEWAEGSPA